MTASDLLAARRKLALTQQQLAAALGVTRQHVNRLERGVLGISKALAMAVTLLLRDAA